MKKLWLLAGLGVLFLGLITGLILIRNRQLIRPQATEQCQPCDGQINFMKLKFLGPYPANVKVIQEQGGQAVFHGYLQPQQEFSFTGTWNQGTLSTGIHIYIETTLDVSIHTSCSDPSVAPGATYGSFYIVAATSRNNGPICPATQPTITSTPIPTLIPTLIPTEQPSTTPTSTPTSTPSPTPSPTPTTPSPTPILTTTPEPSLTPTPSATPSNTPRPTNTPTSTITPTPPPPDTPPGAPNSCNGTCGSDANCGIAQDGIKMICSGGFCRHPSCTDQESCHCPTTTTACLGDLVLNDTNRNGVQDSGETGLGGVTVSIYSGSGTLIASAITDSRGNYRICSLPPGGYTVKYTLPTGYVLNSSHSATQAQVLAGSNSLDIDGYAYLGASTSLPASGATWPTILVGISGIFLILLSLALI